MTARLPYAAFGVVAAVVTGILFGQSAGPGPATILLLAAVAGLAGALVLRSGVPRVAVAFVAFALLGAAVTQRALHGLEESPLSQPLAARADVSVRGELIDDPAGGRWNATVLLRVHSLAVHDARPRDEAWRTGGGRRALVSAAAELASRLRVLEAGDRVTLRGWLEPLTGFDTRARWQHAVGTLHATDLVALAGPSSPLLRVANTARELVLAGGDRMSPTDRAVLSGFLVGDTRGLPYELTEQFRAAGLTHLMAVSGGNVAFVFALFGPLFRRLALRGRLVGGLAVLLVFGTMTRWEPSVLRAVTMASISLVAAFLGRPTAGLRALVLAATVLLVADPFLLHSVGFGLSCGASLGIALFAQPIADRLHGPRWCREVLAATAAAQVGVAPVLIPVFGSMPLVALPANLVAVPLAGPLTIWGLASGVASGVIGPYASHLAALVQLPTVGLLRAILSVADLASRVPITVDGRALWGCVAVAALAGAATRARRSRKRIGIPRVQQDGRDGMAVPAR